MLTVPETVAPEAGFVSPTVGAVVSLETVTLRSELDVLPAASRATAVTLCAPFGTLPDDQLTEYGAVVSSAPRLPPSILNCTPTTATLSEAVAATLTAPETVAPAPGLVSATDGAVVSPGGGGGGGGGVLVFETVTVRCEVAVLPAASRATAVTVCVPFETLPDDQLAAYGALVSSAPRLPPSILNCTPTTPTLSDAFAATFTEPETVAPASGLVRATLGSGGVTGRRRARIGDVDVRDVSELLPAASRATAVTVCVPFETLPDDQLAEYGALVSCEPTFAPSTSNCTPTTATSSDAFAASSRSRRRSPPRRGL